MITNLNSDFVMECINNATVNKLLEAGKKTGSTDYAVLYYRNKRHPKFFKNKEALKKAIRRIYTLGAFNHREIIEDVLEIEDRWLEKCAKKYEIEIHNNLNIIVKRVNNVFDSKKEELKRLVFEEIKTSFSSKLPHYELIFPSYCDYSGDLKEDGLISKELTIREFLEEYTGSWKATFTPGYGKEWLTYGESLSYDILEWAYNIMHTEIIKYLKKIFPKDVKILDCKKLRFFLDTAYDEVYDESITCDFFCYEIIFEFLKDVADIENMKVEDILNQFK